MGGIASCSMPAGMGWIGMGVGTVLMVAFWAVVVWAGLQLYRRWNDERPSRAEAVLAKRLAAGDISEDEYQSRLDRLRSARLDRDGIWSR
jgi:uncharacterized membrane protein